MKKMRSLPGPVLGRTARTQDCVPSSSPSGGVVYSKTKATKLTSQSPLLPDNLKASAVKSKPVTQQREKEKYTDGKCATTRKGVDSSFHFPKSNCASSAEIMVGYSPVLCSVPRLPKYVQRMVKRVERQFKAGPIRYRKAPDLIKRLTKVL